MSRVHDALRDAECAVTSHAAPDAAHTSIYLGAAARVIVHDEPYSIMADRLRLLRTHLRNLWSADKLKSLLITSPLPNDGKSTVALNLATVLAEQGRRKVLLIEADLHHPTIAKKLDLDHTKLAGLCECLRGHAKPHDAIRRITPIEIYLLTAGKASVHPTELLQGDGLSIMMKSFREQFDWTVIDAPPVKPLSDALLLRQRADATLLVIRAGHTPSPTVDDAVTLLGKKNILGMVLNGVEGLDRTYDRYNGSYASRG